MSLVQTLSHGTGYQIEFALIYSTSIEANQHITLRMMDLISLLEPTYRSYQLEDRVKEKIGSNGKRRALDNGRRNFRYEIPLYIFTANTRNSFYYSSKACGKCYRNTVCGKVTAN